MIVHRLSIAYALPWKRRASGARSAIVSMLSMMSALRSIDRGAAMTAGELPFIRLAFRFAPRQGTGYASGTVQARFDEAQ